MHSPYLKWPARGALPCLFMLMVALLWLATPAPAAAHARLVKSEPAAAALLDSPPREINIFLSESVSIEFSSIKVLDRTRQEHAVGELSHVGGDDKSATVPLQDTLTAGTYTVVWRALSSTDGHVTTGSFAFRVRGDGGSDEPITPLDNATTGGGSSPEGDAPAADPLRWITRALIFAFDVFLLGGPLLAFLIIEPALAKNGAVDSTPQQGQAGRSQPRSVLPSMAQLDARLAGLALLVAALLLVALLLDLLLQVTSVTGSDLLAALGRLDLALLTVQSTQYGLAWAIRLVAALALLGLMLFARLARPRRMELVWQATLATASLLLLGHAVGSHAAAIPTGAAPLGLPLPLINDWLHLVMVGAWIGGLGYMALVLFPAFRSTNAPAEDVRIFLGRAIPAFSRLAVISVVVLAVTGTISLLIHSSDPVAILASGYGQLLALKVGLFVALVALGAVNLRRLSPLLAATASRASGKKADNSKAGLRAVPQLARNIRVEALLALVALGCAAGLTLIPPPDDSAAVGAAATATALAAPTAMPTPGPATIAKDVSGYKLTLTTRPALEGDEFTLLVERTDPAVPPLTDVVKVLLKVTPQDIDAGSTSYLTTYGAIGSGDAGAALTPGPAPSPTLALDAGRQVWSLVSPILTLDGGYLVTATVQRSVADDIKAAFRLDLSTESGLSASPGQVIDILVETAPSPPITGTAVLTYTIVDETGAPITDAQVTVSPFMPAHGHVEPLADAMPVAGQPGSYYAPVEFPMGGSWLFILVVQREGMLPVKIDISLDVEDPYATPEPESSPAALAGPRYGSVRYIERKR